MHTTYTKNADGTLTVSVTNDTIHSLEQLKNQRAEIAERLGNRLAEIDKLIAEASK